MDEEEITEVCKTGKVATAMIKRMTEEDKILLGFRLRDREREIKQAEKQFLKTNNELEKS